MTRRTKRIGAASAAVALALGGGVAVAGAAGGDDNERPITGTALERASEAALGATGGGAVTETEVGDEESYYEVEVTLEDGSQVDVQLDRDFSAVSSETESANEDENGSADG